jgi:hypothetical protein
VNKREALDIAITAMFREILREDSENRASVPVTAPPPMNDDPNPRPQFDFDESTCEHGGLIIDRSVCPIHGPGAMGPPPTAEELDDITDETVEEANPLIARAERKRRQRETAQRNTPLYPEEIPMSGIVGRPPDEPPLVV